MKLHSLTLLVSLLVLIIACDKADHDHDNNLSATVITIQTPTANQSYSGGDTLQISIEFKKSSSTETIHNISVEVINETNSNEQVDYVEQHVHADGSHNYTATLILPTVATSSDFKVIASSWGHGGVNDDHASEEVSLTVDP